MASLGLYCCDWPGRVGQWIKKKRTYLKMFSCFKKPHLRLDLCNFPEEVGHALSAAKTNYTKV